MTDAVCYRCGHFELEPDERRLLAAGAPVAVRPRAFDLLLTLVERAGHLVTKDELLERVWPRVTLRTRSETRHHPGSPFGVRISAPIHPARAAPAARFRALTETEIL